MSTKAVTSVGTQAGIFNSRVIASYILDLLEKCHEIHEIFKRCSQELQEGRANLDSSEQTMEKMQTTVKTFSETMDNLGVQLLQGNVVVAQRILQIEKLKKEIEFFQNVCDMEARVNVLQENAPALTSLVFNEWKYDDLYNVKIPDNLAKKESVEVATEHTDLHGKRERIEDLKRLREKLELQLRRVNRDIDSTYEDMFETQEKLYALKDLREIRRESACQELAILKEEASNTTDRKRDILTVTDAKTFDMSGMYVSPTAFAVLEADIEALKHQQIQVQRHIQMQREEREFLRETANAVIQRVYDLEKKVRKETGDHGWESTLVAEPNWLQDLSGPSIWYTSPPLSLDQLNRLRERHFQNYSFSHAICDRNENEATSGETSEDIVLIDITEQKSNA